MVTVEKLQRGVARYLDAEIMPQMHGKDKWIMSGMATLYINKIPSIVTSIKDKPAVRVLGIIGEDGSVDAESVINAIRPAARTSSAAIDFPLVGNITFSEQDLDMLLHYINS